MQAVGRIFVVYVNRSDGHINDWFSTILVVIMQAIQIIDDIIFAKPHRHSRELEMKMKIGINLVLCALSVSHTHKCMPFAANIVSWTQWAAVNTYSLLISAPEHMDVDTFFAKPNEMKNQFISQMKIERQITKSGSITIVVHQSCRPRILIDKSWIAMNSINVVRITAIVCRQCFHIKGWTTDKDIRSVILEATR